MIASEIEMTLSGAGRDDRPHLIRLELKIGVGVPAKAPSMTDPGSPGEGPEIDIISGWVQRKRSSGYVMEKPIPKSVIAKLKDDDELAEWLFQRMTEGFPNA